MCVIYWYQRRRRRRRQRCCSWWGWWCTSSRWSLCSCSWYFWEQYWWRMRRWRHFVSRCTFTIRALVLDDDNNNINNDDNWWSRLFSLDGIFSLWSFRGRLLSRDPWHQIAPRAYCCHFIVIIKRFCFPSAPSSSSTSSWFFSFFRLFPFFSIYSNFTLLSVRLFHRL